MDEDLRKGLSEVPLHATDRISTSWDAQGCNIIVTTEGGLTYTFACGRLGGENEIGGLKLILARLIHHPDQTTFGAAFWAGVFLELDREIARSQPTRTKL